MPNLLEGLILDREAGLYSNRVLGSRGQDCEFDGSILSNTCLFQSDSTALNLTYWDNYVELNKSGASGKFDLGFQKEGYVFHPQFGELYVKPDIYSSLSIVDVWIESTRSAPTIGTLGWMNLSRENILRHWAFSSSYIVGSSMGTFQYDLGVFMYRDATSAYHAFIANSAGNIFVSAPIDNLSDAVGRNINYYLIT